MHCPALNGSSSQIIQPGWICRTRPDNQGRLQTHEQLLLFSSLEAEAQDEIDKRAFAVWTCLLSRRWVLWKPKGLCLHGPIDETRSTVGSMAGGLRLLNFCHDKEECPGPCHSMHANCNEERDSGWTSCKIGCTMCHRRECDDKAKCHLCIRRAMNKATRAPNRGKRGLVQKPTQTTAGQEAAISWEDWRGQATHAAEELQKTLPLEPLECVWKFARFSYVVCLNPKKSWNLKWVPISAIRFDEIHLWHMANSAEEACHEEGQTLGWLFRNSMRCRISSLLPDGW